MFLIARLFIVLGITSAIFVLFSRGKPPAEPFTLSSISSVPIDPQANHKNSAFYELENLEYESALRKTFPRSCITSVETSTWSHFNVTTSASVPAHVKAAYDTALKVLEAGIKNSKYLVIPSDFERFHENSPSRTSMQFHVIKPQLISFRLPPNNSNAVLLQIEMAIHRDYKYQAKHVEFWVLVEQNSKVSVMVVNVVGIVFGDALFALTENGVSGSEQDSIADTAHHVPTIFPSSQ